MSILLTYLSETLTPNLPSLGRSYRGPFTDAHSGAVFITHIAEPEWMMYCTPGWEGNEGIEVAVVYDGDCHVPCDLTVEWTGDVKKDGKLWREAVTEYLSHLTPEAGAPGWRQVELDSFGAGAWDVGERLVMDNVVHVHEHDGDSAAAVVFLSNSGPIRIIAGAATEQGAVDALAEKFESIALGARLCGDSRLGLKPGQQRAYDRALAVAKALSSARLTKDV